MLSFLLITSKNHLLLHDSTFEIEAPIQYGKTLLGNKVFADTIKD